MSATGDLTYEAIFYKCLASLLANKWGDDYSVVMGWLRCSLSFFLLRSANQCICGARSAIGHYVSAPPGLYPDWVESSMTIDNTENRR